MMDFFLVYWTERSLGEHCLETFKAWIEETSLPKKTNGNQEKDDKLIFSRLRRLRGRISFPEGFPSEAIIRAYSKPLVEQSSEAFSWSRPNIEGIREFTKRKLEWPQDRVDQLLLPALKKYDEQESYQTNIDVFFPPNSLKPIEKITKRKHSNDLQKRTREIKKKVISRHFDVQGKRSPKKPKK